MALLDKVKSFLGLDEEEPAPTKAAEPVIPPIDDDNKKILAEIRALPDDTTEIDLKSRPLTSLAGVKLPSKLKVLDLSFTNLSNLGGVMLPRGLKKLMLAYTPLTSLDDVKIPEKLSELWLDGTQLTTLDNVTLPRKLDTLVLSSSHQLGRCDTPQKPGISFSWRYPSDQP